MCVFVSQGKGIFSGERRVFRTPAFPSLAALETSNTSLQHLSKQKVTLEWEIFKSQYWKGIWRNGKGKIWTEASRDKGTRIWTKVVRFGVKTKDISKRHTGHLRYLNIENNNEKSELVINWKMYTLAHTRACD